VEILSTFATIIEGFGSSLPSYTLSSSKPLFFYFILTGFLSRLPNPNLIVSRLKGKCSEYERHSPNFVAKATLQMKRQRRMFEMKTVSQRFLCEANPSLVMRNRWLELGHFRIISHRCPWGHTAHCKGASSFFTNKKQQMAFSGKCLTVSYMILSLVLH